MIFYLSLALFFLLHLLPFNPELRNRLVTKWGLKRYKLNFRIAAILIVLLGIYGWRTFDNIYYYEPRLALKQAHIAFMIPIVFLLVIAEVPNNFKRFIPHPMLTGVQLGTLSHLFANGDLRSMIFFLSFLFFATWARWKSNKKSEQPVYEKQALRYDLKACLIAGAVYILLIALHGYLFGMPVYHYVL